MSDVLTSWLYDPDVRVKLQLLHAEYEKLGNKQISEMISKTGQICDYERGFIAGINAAIKLPEGKLKQSETGVETSEPT